MSLFKKAEWIQSKLFYEAYPINVYKKELSDRIIPKNDDKYRNNHMLVRRVFRINEPIKNAKISISADDYYKLYINGKYVGQGPAQAYHFSCNCNYYDISSYLKQGENIVAVHVFYMGHINRAYVSGDLRQGLIAEITLNNKAILYTDPSWKYKIAEEFISSELVGYGTQFVEYIDERLKMKNWRELSFDDSDWNKALARKNDDHTLVEQITPAIEIYEIYPQKIERLSENRLFIDWGEEQVGYLSMKACGKKNEKIEIRYGEELEGTDPPSVLYNMRCLRGLGPDSTHSHLSNVYQDFWVLSGKDDEFEPFDYKGFRYTEIIGDIESIDIDSLKVLRRHYPYNPDKCLFESSDTLLNDIWAICKNSVILGSQESFVDCPTREKGQYLGDLTVSVFAHFYIFGDSRLYKKALNDFALSSFVCPGLMAVAPSSLMQEIADYSLQYPSQLLTYYMHTGDIDFLKSTFKYAKGCVDYFKRYARADGLLENVKDKWNLVDWPENFRDNYDFDLSKPHKNGCHNVINAFYIGAVQAVGKMADILNIYYESNLSSLVKSYQKAFFNTDIALFADTESSAHASLHSNAMALYLGIAPNTAITSIIELIKKKRLSCGVYMAYFVLKALAKYEEYDLVYELITSDDMNSWTTMVEEGATACFEVWSKDLKYNTSLCHPWASAPIIVLIEDIVGLRPKKPGWEEFYFSPHIPDTLKEIMLEINTPAGRIRVEHKNGSTNLIKS
jgi:hypothetical protein